MLRPNVRALIILTLAVSGAFAADLGLRPPRYGVYVVAHRGAHDDIPENTLAAYSKAIELGADFVEIDIRTTKDGAFVSIHNDTVGAYTQGAVTANVHDLTLAELKALDIGSRISPLWKDERIPTFQEILDLCQGKIGIYLDLKDAPVAPLVREIQSRKMEKDVVWYADIQELKEVHDLCADCIPMPDPGPAENLDAVLSLAPKVVASAWRHFSQDFVERCHAAGAIVIVDESTPDCWREVLEWGTDGIQTNHPATLIAQLKERQINRGAEPNQ